MERTREASEAERHKLLDLVQTLEFKLNAIEQVNGEKKTFLTVNLSSLTDFKDMTFPDAF